jgi:signal transduction histidine kinase
MVAERTRELETARAKAEDASAAKSIFLMTMSHELRTPLTSIISYAELIEEVAREDGRETEAADAATIVGASHHLLTLISEVLDFSKLEAGKVEVENRAFLGSDLFAEIARTMRPVVEGNGSVLAMDVQPLGTLVSDQFRLRQCILNLVSNAAKFTRDGKVSIVVRRDATFGQDAVHIQVCDTGIGMSPDVVERIFEPFKQADETITRMYGGTGLGLAITKKLVTALGGEISVKSAPGEGSTFEIWLPANPAGEAQASRDRSLALANG